MIKVIVLILLLFLSATQIHAHPGGTDGRGGHKCHKNCTDWGLSTGEYHFHNLDGSVKKVESSVSDFPQSAPTYTPVIRNTAIPTKTPTRNPSATPTKPEPTTTPVPIQADPSPTATIQKEQEGSNPMGGLISMGIFGGLGYLGYKKLKKKNPPEYGTPLTES